ncbi:MAG: LVIVD repeat-containing protein [Candidatus Thorarchaeota archaeon]
MNLKNEIGLACLLFLVIASSSALGVNAIQIAQSNGPGYDVTVTETHAFVTNNDGVAVYDIQNPSEPDRLGQIDLGGEARGIEVIGDIIYIAGLSHGLIIADINDNPTNPIILAEYTLSDYISEVCIYGDYAYLSSGFGEFQILDISNPSTPVGLGHLPISELTLGIAVSGSTVYIAQPNSGLRLIDVSNLNSPFILSLVSGTSGARDLHVQGDLLYVARGTSGVSIFDISDSSNPMPLGQYNDGGNSFGIHGDSQYLLIADLEQGVELLDISNPETPVEVAQHDDAAPHDLIYNNCYAYLADQDEEFLIVNFESSISITTTGGSDNSLQFLSTIIPIVGVCAVAIFILRVLKKRS